MEAVTYLERALELAERGRGTTGTNPIVGAVVVADGEVVGEGWHERKGEAHAEVNALAAAGAFALLAREFVSNFQLLAALARDRDLAACARRTCVLIRMWGRMGRSHAAHGRGSTATGTRRRSMFGSPAGGFWRA